MSVDLKTTSTSYRDVTNYYDERADRIQNVIDSQKKLQALQDDTTRVAAPRPGKQRTDHRSCRSTLFYRTPPPLSVANHR